MHILIVALQKNGTIVPSTYEMITAARELGGAVSTLVMAPSAESLGAELAKRGGGTVLAASHADFQQVNDEQQARIIAQAVSDRNCTVVIAPSTFYGKAVMSRAAALCGAGMASDVSGISAQGTAVEVYRSHFGGSVISTVKAAGADKPLFVTIRPKIYPESTAGEGSVVPYASKPEHLTTRARVIENKSETGGTLNLGEADIIVAAGRGMRGPEHLDIVRDLAQSLGAAFGASRAVVDAGWVPYAHQVGQTGRTVNPKLYIAVAISGAIQHLVGMRTSKTIVAVNKDKDAPIFGVSTYGIVGDAFEVVPALTRRFKAEFGR